MPDAERPLGAADLRPPADRADLRALARPRDRPPLRADVGRAGGLDAPLRGHRGADHGGRGAHRRARLGEEGRARRRHRRPARPASPGRRACCRSRRPEPADRLRARGRGAAAGPAPRLRRQRPGDVAPAARRAVRRVHRDRLGRAGSRPFRRSARVVRHGRLRRPPRGVHRRARARAAARGRALVRRRARDRAPSPAPRDPADADPRLRLRGLGGLAAAGRGRPPARPGAGAGRPATRALRERGRADHVRRRDTARLPGQPARVPPGRCAGHGAGRRGGGPARRAAGDRRADTAVVRRARRARPARGGRGAAHRHTGLPAGVPARRPRLQHRGAGAVQRRGARASFRRRRTALPRRRARSRAPRRTSTRARSGASWPSPRAGTAPPA